MQLSSKMMLRLFPYLFLGEESLLILKLWKEVHTREKFTRAQSNTKNPTLKKLADPCLPILQDGRQTWTPKSCWNRSPESRPIVIFHNPSTPISHFFLINLFTYIGAFACCSLTECPAKFTVHIIPSRQSNTLTGLHTKYIYSINSSGHMYYLANSLTLTLMTHTYIV